MPCRRHVPVLRQLHDCAHGCEDTFEIPIGDLDIDYNHSGGVMGWRLAGVMCAAFFALTAAAPPLSPRTTAVTQNAPPAQDCLGEDSDILCGAAALCAR